MRVPEAFALISAAIDRGCAANGYLVCGDVSGECTRLADMVLAKLFPGCEVQLEAREHPDVFWLEPQGRSRTIKIERGKDDDGPGMRDGLLEPMSVTSYSGGWKAGVIAGADRMQPAAANAFLKLLEEPPPKTMFLLLADSPESILPTIASRSHRIDLAAPDAALSGGLLEEARGIFLDSPPDGVFAKNAAGARLAAILDSAMESGDYGAAPAARKAFFRTIDSFVRRWIEEGSLPMHLAFRNAEAVEIAFRQCERSMNAEAVLSLMLDRMTFP